MYVFAVLLTDVANKFLSLKTHGYIEALLCALLCSGPVCFTRRLSSHNVPISAVCLSVCLSHAVCWDDDVESGRRRRRSSSSSSIP